jgi:hypothetical protein
MHLAIQAGPAFHYNNVRRSGEALGAAKPFNTGVRGGAEIGYTISDRWSLNGTFLYTTQGLSLVHNQFFGYLSAESNTYRKYLYESNGGTLSLSGRLYKNIRLTAGVGYSVVCERGYELGYKYRGSEYYNGGLEIEFGYNSNTSKVYMPYIVLGIRNRLKNTKAGIFDYGISFYLPVKKMPVTGYTQTLRTDNSVIISAASYHTKTFSAVLHLGYYLFNFDRSGRLLHPGRKKPLTPFD